MHFCLYFLLQKIDIWTIQKFLLQEAPIPAMDSLTSAMKNNIVPNQEYLLQGSVLDSAVEVLLHRLRGLCDNVDSGPETFHDHEMCFSISNVLFSIFSRIYLVAISNNSRYHISLRECNAATAHAKSQESDRLFRHAVPASLHRTAWIR